MNAAQARKPAEAEAFVGPQPRDPDIWYVTVDPRAVESPARRLQMELRRNWTSEAGEERWSPRKSLSFILIGSCCLWAALIWGFILFV